jgi:hypothetical protein
MFGLFLLFSSNTSFAGTEITIDVAPNVLNLQNQAEVVTVHTNIVYSIVAGSTVCLNGVEINYWKSDDRGYFVAKFLMEEIKELPLDLGGMNVLTLTGTTKTGIDFFGSQKIKVIDVKSAGKK